MKTKNWKTTLFGFLGAFWLLAQPIITKGDFEITRDWEYLVGAALAACLGLVSKDGDVTGGTRPQ